MLPYTAHADAYTGLSQLLDRLEASRQSQLEAAYEPSSGCSKVADTSRLRANESFDSAQHSGISLSATLDALPEPEPLSTMLSSGVSGHSHSGNLDSADLGLQGVRSQTPAWAPRFYPEPVPSMSRTNTSGFDGGSGYALSAEIHGASDPSVAEALLKSARRELQMMTVARDAAVADAGAAAAAEATAVQKAQQAHAIIAEERSLRESAEDAARHANTSCGAAEARARVLQEELDSTRAALAEVRSLKRSNLRDDWGGGGGVPVLSSGTNIGYGHVVASTSGRDSEDTNYGGGHAVAGPEEANQRFLDLSSERDKLALEVDSLQAEIAAMRIRESAALERAHESEARALDAEKHRLECNETISRLEQQLEERAFSQKMEYAVEQSSSATATPPRVVALMAELRRECESLRGDNARLITTLEEKSQAKVDEGEMNKLRESLETEQSRAEEAERQCMEQRKLCEELRAKFEEYREAVLETEQRVNTAESLSSELQTAAEVTEIREQELMAEVQRLEALVLAKEQDLANTKSTCDSISNEAQQKSSSLQAAEARIIELEAEPDGVSVRAEEAAATSEKKTCTNDEQMESLRIALQSAQSRAAMAEETAARRYSKGADVRLSESMPAESEVMALRRRAASAESALVDCEARCQALLMAVSEAEAARVRSAKQAEESRRAFADVLRESKPCISVQTQTQCSSDAEAAISIDPSGDDVAAAEAEAQFVSTAAGAKATAKLLEERAAVAEEDARKATAAAESAALRLQDAEATAAAAAERCREMDAAADEAEAVAVAAENRAVEADARRKKAQTRVERAESSATAAEERAKAIEDAAHAAEAALASSLRVAEQREAAAAGAISSAAVQAAVAASPVGKAASVCTHSVPPSPLSASSLISSPHKDPHGTEDSTVGELPRHNDEGGFSPDRVFSSSQPSSVGSSPSRVSSTLSLSQGRLTDGRVSGSSLAGASVTPLGVGLNDGAPKTNAATASPPFSRHEQLDDSLEDSLSPAKDLEIEESIASLRERLGSVSQGYRELSAELVAARERHLSPALRRSLAGGRRGQPARNDFSPGADSPDARPPVGRAAFLHGGGGARRAVLQ